MNKEARIVHSQRGGGGTPDEPMIITTPLVIMFQQPDDKAVTCHIHAPSGYDHKHYGLLICDLVRHVAKAFKVDEDDVWDWIDKERHRPTTEIREPS